MTLHQERFIENLEIGQPISYSVFSYDDSNSNSVYTSMGYVKKVTKDKIYITILDPKSPHKKVPWKLKRTHKVKLEDIINIEKIQLED